VSVLIAFFAAITLVLFPFEIPALRARAKDEQLRIGWLAASALALTNIVLSLALGAAAFYVVLFGPSHLTGDFIGLHWLTAIPALIVGFCSAKFVSRAYLKVVFSWLSAREA